MPRSFGLVSPHRRSKVGRASLLPIVAVATLLVRLYLARLWLGFGLAKIEAGWLTANPVRGLLAAVAAGQTPMPIPGLSVVASWLLAVHADAALSILLPLTELALAAAFLTGLLAQPAAALGIAVNTSLILGGLASVGFDGRVIALELIVLAAGVSAGVLGVPGIARVIRAVRRRADWLVDGPGQQPRRRAA